MLAAIDRVMQTYGMLVNLTGEEEQAAREKVAQHLSRLKADERELAIEGLRFLRDPNRSHRVRARKLV